MDTLFCSSNNSLQKLKKYVKEVGISADTPPVGPEGQIWVFFLNEPSLKEIINIYVCHKQVTSDCHAL